MSYGSSTGVEALVPAVGTIDANSTPTLDQVNTWLAESAAMIDAVLAGAGYSLPVSDSATAALAYLAALNNLYAAGQTLRARGLDSLSGQTENRSGGLMREFQSGLNGLRSADLTALGMSVQTGASVKRRRIRTLQARRVDGYGDSSSGEY